METQMSRDGDMRNGETDTYLHPHALQGQTWDTQVQDTGFYTHGAK